MKKVDCNENIFYNFFIFNIARLVNYKGMPLKPGSLNNRVKAVRSLLVYMKKCGYIVYDMKDHILYVKEPSLLPTSVLTHAQVKKFMSSVDTSNHEGCRNRAMLEILYSRSQKTMMPTLPARTALIFKTPG